MNANYFIQNFQKVDNQNQLKTAVLTAPVNVTPVEIPKPISFDLDASNGFESAGFKPTAAYLSNITRELKNKISSSTKSITISVFSSMRPDSPHTSQNYQFHENLTKNRAEAIVRALKQNSDFQFIQFIAVGMGAAEDNLGKKVNFLISAK